jgi:heat-inducible transcriptional repressor
MTLKPEINRDAPSMNPRKSQILRAVVENYIQTAGPVSSQALSKFSRAGLSAATIRNVMAGLEEGGYLEQPHTSAGRVPTEKGFRFYIDRLVEVEPLEAEVEEQIRHSLDEATDAASKFQIVSKTLSGLSKHVGLILAPPLKASRLRHMEFLPLREGQILAILVTEQGVVQNRILEVEESFSSADLIRMSNYLNSLLGGIGLGEVKRRVLLEMERQKDKLDLLLRRALVLSQELVANEVEIFIEGEKNFLYNQEFSNLGKIREILEALEEKQRLVELLNKALNASGVQIFIGSESRPFNIDGCSVIVSHYGSEKKPLGTLGVIGPTRMAYSRLIPIVDFTARLLGENLTS